MAYANDSHSQFIDSYFKGLADAQETATREQQQRQFDAVRAQEAQRIAIEQQNSQNTAAYQKALAANMQAQAAQRQRENALDEQARGIQFQPPTQPQSVQTAQALPLAGGQGVYGQMVQAPAPPVGPQAPAQFQMGVGPGDQAQQSARSAALVPAQTYTLSPDQVLAGQHLQRVNGYPAPPGQEAVMPDLQGQIARGQMIKRAGEIPTPEWLKQVGWTEDTIDPKQLEELMKSQIAAGKPSTASANARADGIEAKIRLADGIPAGALPGSPQYENAINAAANRGTISRQEAADLLTHRNSTTSAGAQQYGGVLRAQTYGQYRSVPYMDASTNRIGFGNPAEVNNNPNAVPEAAGERILTLNARYGNLHQNLDSMDKAVKNMGDISATTRAQLAYAMKGHDPNDALQTFAQGEAVAHLPEAQREYIQSLAVLSDDIQYIARVPGLGAGMDLREKLNALVPSLVTDSKYAQGQLAKLRALVSNMQQGIPTLGQQPKVNNTTAPATNTTILRFDANGNPVK